MGLLHKLIVIFLFATLSLTAQAQVENKINWLTFEQLNDSLAIKAKPVLIFFHTEWCAYCKKMLNESFTAKKVTELLSRNYYVVKFDAESVDSVYFDGVLYTNVANRKTTGTTHTLANILMGKENPAVFPVTITLNKDFTMVNRKFNYLSTKQLLNIL